MRKSFLIALTVAMILCVSAMISAAPAKKPVKPAAKTPAKKTTPAKPTVPAKQTTTAQLPGDNGVFDTVYTLRKSDPLYFRLKSAEYTTDQLIIGDLTYVPKADEKMLVLHFTVQNPQKSELFVRWDSLNITAVDSRNTNHEYIRDWGDKTGRQSVNMSLKPTQTIDVYTAIIVPAKGMVPKLMILPPDENDGPILRYDLNNPKNKVSPLKAPIADPSDPNGYTAIETVPGALNTAYPYGLFDIAVQKFEYTSDAIKDVDLEEGMRYMMVTLLVKNESHDNVVLRWDTVQPVLLSADGEELQYLDMLLATANRGISRNPKFGEEITVRLCFVVPEDSTATTLKLSESESRTYEIKVQ